MLLPCVLGHIVILAAEGGYLCSPTDAVSNRRGASRPWLWLVLRRVDVCCLRTLRLPQPLWLLVFCAYEARVAGKVVSV